MYTVYIKSIDFEAQVEAASIEEVPRKIKEKYPALQDFEEKDIAKCIL